MVLLYKNFESRFKLYFKSCKFSSDKDSALNKKKINLKSFILFDENNQIFSKERVFKANLILNNEKEPIIKIILPLICIALMIFLIGKIRKFIVNSNDKQEENESVDKNEILNENIDSLL